MYDVYVVEDSIAPNGERLSTVAATMPRIVLAEQNTHRDFSRNTASSRAIPVKTRCDMIEKNPFVPSVFGKNRKGMQATEFLDAEKNALAEAIWREALSDNLRHARRMEELGVHKQYANRLTETFAWVTQLITATRWQNYKNLRIHKDAQPEICQIATLIKEALDKSTPKLLKEGEQHLPFVPKDDETLLNAMPRDATMTVEDLYRKYGPLLSVARCAAVSYEKHHIKKTLAEEIERHDGMRSSGHMSPFEHQAWVANDEEILEHASFRWSKVERKFVPKMIGNFGVPWLQYRKTLPGEDVFTG